MALTARMVTIDCLDPGQLMSSIWTVLADPAGNEFCVSEHG